VGGLSQEVAEPMDASEWPEEVRRGSVREVRSGFIETERREKVVGVVGAIMEKASSGEKGKSSITGVCGGAGGVGCRLGTRSVGIQVICIGVWGMFRSKRLVPLVSCDQWREEVKIDGWVGIGDGRGVGDGRDQSMEREEDKEDSLRSGAPLRWFVIVL
jgi:hypothetical protein